MKWVVLGIVFGVLFIVAYFICKKIDKIEETNKKIYVDKKKVSEMNRSTGGIWKTKNNYTNYMSKSIANQ